MIAIRADVGKGEVMESLEDRIKDFARRLGVEVVGIAGPERLHGPPSLDLSYTMPGARSVVAMALPMHEGALYEFLAKRSPAPHNLDQFLNYQRLQRIGKDLADYLVSQGHRAVGVPLSADYRRAVYVFRPRPAFSLRLGAVAAGIAAQGWSGNAVTREYGASVYLGAVLTDANLRSDPPLPPRYFTDGFCAKCKRCVKACPTGMFVAGESEYLLLNGELLPRGRRRFPLRASPRAKARDALASIVNWHRYYGGLEPRTLWRSRVYALKLRAAIRAGAPGKCGERRPVKKGRDESGR